MVLESRDRLNYDSSYILSLISSQLDGVSNLIEASIFLGSVLVLKLSHRILDLGEWCSWPVESGHSLQVNSIV